MKEHKIYIDAAASSVLNMSRATFYPPDGMQVYIAEEYEDGLHSVQLWTRTHYRSPSATRVLIFAATSEVAAREVAQAYGMTGGERAL